MKKTVLLLSGLLLSSLSFSQTLTFAPVNDYPTLIANIFGVQCEGVSNVQVTAHPQSIGRFENGQSFGLSSGLAMTTGVLFQANQPNTNFLSADNGFPQDTDIYNYGVANGQTPVNFNACVVEFDFNPQVSDSVKFKYILASEEYPEYSPSAYTDRFLFLVSENGNPSQNVALLPDGITLVEINTVNPSVNSQYYFNNSIGPNAATFAFDGYTVTFEAKFFAQIGSTYHIKLVIADVADAIYDSAIFLDEQDTYNDIHGDLTINGQLATGTIDVFSFLQDTILATPIAVIPVTNGSYLADSLPSGLYHVRFTPDPILFPTTAPFYYTNGDTWSTATAVALPCFLDSAGISLSPFNVQNGSGTISGMVTIDTSYNKAVTEPLANALLKLIDNGNGDVVGFTYSDVNGLYTFNQISTGSYSIIMDVPYIPQLNDHTIQVIDGQNIVGADFEVLTDGIHAIDNVQLSLNEEQAAFIKMYPNPATTELTVINASGSNLQYSIYGLNGLLILEGTINIGSNKIDVNDLNNGFYMIKTGDSDVRKISIQK